MKAILVIDTPKECSDCPCINLLGIYCQADKRNRYCLLEDKEEWCPLKPMPKRMLTLTRINNGEILNNNEIQYMKGRNDCIDELLGEEDE